MPKKQEIEPDVSKWIEDHGAYEAAMMAAIEALLVHQPGATVEKCQRQINWLRMHFASRWEAADARKVRK